jgi:hypothetical protein
MVALNFVEIKARVFRNAVKNPSTWYNCRWLEKHLSLSFPLYSTRCPSNFTGDIKFGAMP